MPLGAETPDADFERRWTAWKARGLAHEDVVRGRFLTSAIIILVVALGALVAYAVRSS